MQRGRGCGSSSFHLWHGPPIWAPTGVRLLPATALGKLNDDGFSACDAATHIGDSDGTLASWLWTAPAIPVSLSLRKAAPLESMACEVLTEEGCLIDLVPSWEPLWSSREQEPGMCVWLSQASAPPCTCSASLAQSHGDTKWEPCKMQGTGSAQSPAGRVRPSENATPCLGPQPLPYPARELAPPA